MKITNRARAPSHDPKLHAIWTPDALKEELDYFMTETFPKTPHEGVFGLPGELFQKSLREQGVRKRRYIAYDEALRVMTMPLFSRQVTVHYNKGIRLDYFWYRCDELFEPKWRGTKVTVRLEPEDASYVMVLLGTEWYRADTRSTVLRGLSHRDLQMLTEECKAEARLTNRAKRLNPLELECFIARIRRRELELRDAKAQHSRDAKSPDTAPSVPNGNAPVSESVNELEFEDDDFAPAPAIKVAKR